MDPEIVRALFAALASERVDYVLVGALALDVHGMGRLTEDVDLFLKPTSENVERLKRALARVWDDPTIDDIHAEDLAGEFPVIRYGAPDGTTVDLIGRIGEAFSYDDLESTELDYGELRVRVATPRTLYGMKRNTVRPQDKVDAERLKNRFRLEE